MGNDIVLGAVVEHLGGRIAYPHGVEPEPAGNAGVQLIAYEAKPGLLSSVHPATQVFATNTR